VVGASRNVLWYGILTSRQNIWHTVGMHFEISYTFLFETLSLVEIVKAFTEALSPLKQLDDRAVDVVMTKLFSNYRKWCKFLSRKHSLRSNPLNLIF
jgi:hypothetical protein